MGSNRGSLGVRWCRQLDGFRSSQRRDIRRTLPKSPTRAGRSVTNRTGNDWDGFKPATARKGRFQFIIQSNLVHN